MIPLRMRRRSAAMKKRRHPNMDGAVTKIPEARLEGGGGFRADFHLITSFCGRDFREGGGGKTSLILISQATFPAPLSKQMKRSPPDER